MKVKVAFAVLISLSILALTYFLGYKAGKRDDDRSHLHLNIDKDVYLYHEVESGDLKAVKQSLGFFTFGDYDFYMTHYSNENWSPGKLETAHQIATLAATNGSIVWFTNH
jgi:hypothetical protein